MFHVKRPNTLEFSLSPYLRRQRDKVSREEVIASLKSSLNQNEFSKIKCIQASDNGMAFRVTFNENSPRARESLLTKGIHVRNTFLYLAEAEPTFTVVSVSNLPFELSDAAVSTVLKSYGHVKKVLRNVDRNGLETGDRRILMTLDHHIPNLILLDPYRAYVRYRGQPQCCHHCNWWGHTMYKCPLRLLCSSCGSPHHHSLDCHNSAPVPIEFPVTATLEEMVATQPDHPALDLGLDDVSSTHSNEVFPDNFEMLDSSQPVALPPSTNLVVLSQSQEPPVLPQNQESPPQNPCEEDTLETSQGQTPTGTLELFLGTCGEEMESTSNGNLLESYETFSKSLEDTPTPREDSPTPSVSPSIDKGATHPPPLFSPCLSSPSFSNIVQRKFRDAPIDLNMVPLKRPGSGNPAGSKVKKKTHSTASH